MKKISVGLCYNLIQDFPRRQDDAEDIDAEWTEEKDVDTIFAGLTAAGFNVIRIGDPINLLSKVVTRQIDIVFSIAEMTGFRYREAIASTICEMLHIPYTFSPPDVMVVALDKNLSNLVVKNMDIPVPEWFVVRDVSDLHACDLKKFPYIIKPVAEGSSIGISRESIIFTKEQAVLRVEQTVNAYQQPVVVQQFIQGREITIGVIENDGEVIPLTPIEVLARHTGEMNVNGAGSKKAANEDAPKKITDQALASKVKHFASRIFREFSCLGTARIDFREDRDGVLYFLEINPLTDYTPRKDFCKSAFGSGYNYQDILKLIVTNALKYERGKRKR